MPRYATGLGAFMQGFTKMYALMDEAQRRREALKMQEEESKLKGKLLQMQIDKALKMEDIFSQIGQTETRPPMMEGQRPEGTVPQMGRLPSLMMPPAPISEPERQGVPEWNLGAEQMPPAPLAPPQGAAQMPGLEWNLPVPPVATVDETAKASKLKSLIMQTPEGRAAYAKNLIEPQDPYEYKTVAGQIAKIPKRGGEVTWLKPPGGPLGGITDLVGAGGVQGLELQTVSIDPETGLPKITFGRKDYTVDTNVVEIAPGVYQNQRVIRNRHDPNDVRTELLGRPQPAAGISQQENIVRSWALKMGVQSIGDTSQAFRYALGRVAQAQSLSGNDIAQAEQMAAAEREFQQMLSQELQAPRAAQPSPTQPGAAPSGPAVRGPGGVTMPPAPVEDVVAATTRKMAEREAAVTGAREEAKRLETTLSAEDRRRVQMYNSAAEGTRQLMKLYKPEYVGKGIAALRGELNKIAADDPKGVAIAADGKVIPGAIAGLFRQWVGSASADEVTFRRSVMNVINTFLYARSGAQINNAEFARLAASVFGLFDEPATFVPSAQRFYEQMAKEREDIIGMAWRRARDLEPLPPLPDTGGSPKDVDVPSGYIKNPRR